MQSLAQAIKFRLLLNKLDNTEFDQFVLQFIRKCGRDFLITSLFNQFITSNIQNDPQQTLNAPINIINEIIESRKNKPKSSITPKLTINSLPSELIGELSSYLNYAENVAFGKTNRNIYIGCNTPNRLERLDVLYIECYSSFNLQKYPHLVHLTLDLNQFHKLKLPINGQTVCNRLQSLTLGGYKRSDVNIDSFMEQNVINTNNIIRLNLVRFGMFSFGKFIRLVSKFPNIQHFQSWKSGFSGFDPTIKLAQLFPNLISFTNLGGAIDFKIAMLKVFGPKLSGLALQLTQQWFPTDISFSNLKELVLIDLTKPVVNRIFKTAKKLQQIKFAMSPTMNNVDAQNIIEQTLTEQKALQYLGIRCTSYDKHKCICEGVEHGLFRMQYSKKNLKIRLSFGDNNVQMIDMEDVLLSCSRITTQLQTSDVENFMLVYAFKGKSDTNTENMKKEMASFTKKNSLNFTIWYEKSYIVISNKECTMNGRRALLNLTNIGFS